MSSPSSGAILIPLPPPAPAPPQAHCCDIAAQALAASPLAVATHASTAGRELHQNLLLCLCKQAKNIPLLFL